MTFVNRQYLVETDWLAAHLDDPELRIVDCTQYLPGYTDDVAITTVSGRDNYAQATSLARPTSTCWASSPIGPGRGSTRRCRRPSSSPR